MLEVPFLIRDRREVHRAPSDRRAFEAWRQYVVRMRGLRRAQRRRYLLRLRFDMMWRSRLRQRRQLDLWEALAAWWFWVVWQLGWPAFLGAIQDDDADDGEWVLV